MMKENGQDPDGNQCARDAKMQPVYRNHCHCDKNEIEVVVKRLLAETHHREQDQANCRC